MLTIVFTGPPDFLTVHQGSIYIRREAQQNHEVVGIRLTQAPHINPGKIGIMRRYYEPLRADFEKIMSDIHEELTDS